ncbi:hypothetical protein M4B17_04890 [Priestia aryabhattai]|nr:hypothetical protein [Priestia aryabhattai]
MNDRVFIKKQKILAEEVTKSMKSQTLATYNKLNKQKNQKKEVT